MASVAGSKGGIRGKNLRARLVQLRIYPPPLTEIAQSAPIPETQPQETYAANQYDPNRETYDYMLEIFLRRNHI
jgi:hypothetical protein